MSALKVGLLAALAARWARVPVVLTAHGFLFTERCGFTRTLYKALDRLTCRLSRLAFSPHWLLGGPEYLSCLRRTDSCSQSAVGSPAPSIKHWTVSHVGSQGWPSRRIGCSVGPSTCRAYGARIPVHRALWVHPHPL